MYAVPSVGSAFTAPPERATTNTLFPFPLVHPTVADVVVKLDDVKLLACVPGALSQLVEVKAPLSCVRLCTIQLSLYSYIAK